LSSSLSESINASSQYAIISRTTIYRDQKGLHVYLTDIHSNTHEIVADTRFFVRLFSLSGLKNRGKSETKAFILPETFKTEEERNQYRTSIRQLLRTNRSELLSDHFKPYSLDHESRGGRTRIKIGPWQWNKREILNRHQVTPPESTDQKYDPLQHQRTVIQGQVNRIRGSDTYGFFGGIVNQFLSFVNLGGSGRGDDPSTNFFGKSKTLIVSTELETTVNRKNNTLVRIQETHSGWSLRKQKLLKLIEGISKKVPGFIPSGGLMDPDSFVQTRKVQSYQLVWNLSIYEAGLERLLKLLDQSRTSTYETTRAMIELMGEKEYVAFCKSKGMKPGFSSSDLDWDRLELSAIETIKGKTHFVTCATPWMRSIFNIRGSISKKSAAFETDVRNEDVAKEKIKAINEAMGMIERDLDLSLLMRLVGVENTYFQVSLAGFRKGDERAQDEEGRSTYFSNTIGSIHTTTRNGPLDDIARSSTLMQHELSARYLSDGY